MSCRVKKQAGRLVSIVTLAVVWLSFDVLLSAQENWTRFRGPNGTGLVADAELPSRITADNYWWKIQLAGTGSSSPVIWGDKVFVTSCDPQTAELTLQCLNATTGDENWNRTFQSSVYRVHDRNSFASSTPAVDKDHVYITYANPEHTMLIAIDHDGEQKWKRDFGTWVSQHGFGVSPMVYKDNVIFFNSQQAERLREGRAPGESRVISVSCKDGSDVWETQLTATRSCYAVPGIYRDAEGKEQLVSCNTGDGFFSLDPESGEKNWSTLPFRMRTVASMLIVDGLVIGSCGSGGGGNYLVAIRPDEKGVNPPQKAYELQRANYVPSPIAVDGKLFLFNDKGVGMCVDLQTGKLHWEERICRGFSGSPVATSKHVYITDDSGNLIVISVSDKFERVALHSLGEPTRATPAIANNRIYVRTDSHLICIGNKQN